MTRERKLTDAAFHEIMRRVRTNQAATVETARRTLETMSADRKQANPADHCRITWAEVVAIDLVLAELHRLHLAVSTQRRIIEKRGPKTTPRSAPIHKENTPRKGT